MKPYLKNIQHKKGWKNGSVVEHVPSKHEALTSNLYTAKKIIIYLANNV
jgi:hypothetical protein